MTFWEEMDIGNFFLLSNRDNGRILSNDGGEEQSIVPNSPEMQSTAIHLSGVLQVFLEFS